MPKQIGGELQTRTHLTGGCCKTVQLATHFATRTVEIVAHFGHVQGMPGIYPVQKQPKFNDGSHAVPTAVSTVRINTCLILADFCTPAPLSARGRYSYQKYQRYHMSVYSDRASCRKTKNITRRSPWVAEKIEFGSKG